MRYKRKMRNSVFISDNGYKTVAAQRGTLLVKGKGYILIVTKRTPTDIKGDKGND